MPTQQKSKKSHDIGTAIGANVAQARLSKGWTQLELAAKIGIEPVTVSRMETGTSLPSIVRLSQIADILSVSLVDLLRGATTQINDQVQEIAECIAPLKVADRTLVIEIVKQLSRRLANK